MGDGQLTFVLLLMNYNIPISQGKHLQSPVFLNYIHDHTSHKQESESKGKESQVLGKNSSCKSAVCNKLFKTNKAARASL